MKMKVLFDTNVILDLLLDRRPFSGQAVQVIDLSAKKEIEGFVSASAITDIYYVARRGLKSKKLVCSLLKRLLQIVSVAGVTENEINKALESDWSDFEDSVQYYTAQSIEASYIVTRNKQDYQEGLIRAVAPQEFLSLFKLDQ